MSPQHQPHILIVDDSPTIRSVLSRQLGDINAQVTEAADGHEGFEAAMSGNYDLIITDVDMPRMNGFDLCAHLKKQKSTRSTPVVILSTNDRDEDIERGFEVGASAYVTKAQARDELISRITGVLTRADFLRDRTVLVVDDSSFIRNTVRDGLSQAGLTVRTATDGEHGLRELRAHRPDMILCDLNMPRMDGVSFGMQVLNDPNYADIAFVMMSSASDRPKLRRLVQQGAAGYMLKPFDVEQLLLMAERILSDQFRLILQEKKRVESEHDIILGSISSLVFALEARDRYTKGHSEAVSHLACAMAWHMGVAGEDIDLIETAGKLHDIGKIGIRDDLLLKEGKLTDTEYATFKKHSELGAETLRPIPSLARVVPAVLHHHERMDGTGYPHGLPGREIPLWARMISVADVYHALASNRPYRKALSITQVLSIMDDATGDHLCPECVEAFKLVVQSGEHLQVST